jgi:predicted  nucleic acid-binding Zn-ribbon protein
LQKAKATIDDQQRELSTIRSQVSELDPLRAENQRLTEDLRTAAAAKAKLAHELEESRHTNRQQQYDLQQRDQVVRDLGSRLQKMSEGKEEADRQRVLALGERDAFAKQFQQEAAANVNLRAQLRQSRQEFDRCEGERNSTKKMLITQMNRLREANERRFTRIRRLHSEELQTLIATYENRV